MPGLGMLGELVLHRGAPCRPLPPLPPPPLSLQQQQQQPLPPPPHRSSAFIVVWLLTFFVILIGVLLGFIAAVIFFCEGFLILGRNRLIDVSFSPCRAPTDGGIQPGPCPVVPRKQISC